MTAELYSATSNGFTATCDAFVAKDDGKTFAELKLLSVIGSQQAVKAISAAILKSNAEAVGLRPEKDESDLPRLSALRQPMSHWRTRTMRLPQTKAWHTLIYSVALEYNREEPGFVLLGEPGAGNAVDRHLQFLNRRIALPIHPEWKDWLWQRGLHKGEIAPLLAYGVSAWECAPDQEALKADISRGIRDGILKVKKGW